MDVSEGGLGFRAIAPVEADGPIHFRFAIDSANRIKAVGELAWKDETGKIGGLRFTQLPDEIREQIRVWAGQSNAGAKSGANESIFDVSGRLNQRLEQRPPPTANLDGRLGMRLEFYSLPICSRLMTARHSIKLSTFPRGLNSVVEAMAQLCRNL